MRTDRANCPIKRTTDILGDQWSFLILREFFLDGPRRFADLQDQLGLSPNTLSGRLKKLEQAGIVERRMYSDHPPRADYALTDKGKTLSPVIHALYQWGTDHAAD